jgi:hypothetical protein
VDIREDILLQARASGLDISDLCNRALAAATGIDYRGKEPAPVAPAGPVIIAHDGGPANVAGIPKKAPIVGIPPVINADDPRSAAAVKVVPGPVLQKTAAGLPGRIPSPEKEAGIAAAPAMMSTAPLPARPKKPAGKPEKSAKGSPVKKFMADAVIREDAEGGQVTKDALYQAFSHWCREHRITPVPDRRSFTVTLKNKFAMTEKAVDGVPSWVSIRLK